MRVDVERRDPAAGRGERREATAARVEADEGGLTGGLHQRAGGEAQQVGVIGEEDIAGTRAGVERVQRQAAERDGGRAGQLDVLGGGGRGVGGEEGGGGVVVTGITRGVQLTEADAGDVGSQFIATELDPARDNVVDQHPVHVVLPRRHEQGAGVVHARVVHVDRGVDVVLQVGEGQLDAVRAARGGGEQVDVGRAFGQGHDAEVLGGVAPVTADVVDTGGAHRDRGGVVDAVVIEGTAAAVAAVAVVVELERAVAQVERRGAGELGVAGELQDATVDEGRAGVSLVGPERQGVARPGVTDGEGHLAGDDAGEVATVDRVDDEGRVAAGRGDGRRGVGRLIVLEEATRDLDRAIQVQRATVHREVAAGLAAVAPQGVVAGAELHRALVDGVLTGQEAGAVEDDRAGAGLIESDVTAATRPRQRGVERQGLATVDVEEDVGRAAGRDQAVVDGDIVGSQDRAAGRRRTAQRQDGVRGEEEGRAGVHLQGVDLEGGAEIGSGRVEADVLVLEEQREVLGIGQGADITRGSRVGGEGLGVDIGGGQDRARGDGRRRDRAQADARAGHDGGDGRARRDVGAGHRHADIPTGGAAGVGHERATNRVGPGGGDRRVGDEAEGQDDLVVGAVGADTRPAAPTRAINGRRARDRVGARGIDPGTAEEEGVAVDRTATEGAEREGRANRRRLEDGEGHGTALRNGHGAEGLGGGGRGRRGVHHQFATPEGKRAGRPQEVIGRGAFHHGELAAGAEGDRAGTAEGDAVDVHVARADIHRPDHGRAGEVEVDGAGALVRVSTGAGDGGGREVDDPGAARVGDPGEVGTGRHATGQVQGGAILGADDRAGGADGDRAADRGGAAGQAEERAGVVLAARVDRDTLGRVVDGRAAGDRGRDVVIDRDARVRGDGRDVRVRRDVGAGDGEADNVAGGVRHRDDAVTRTTGGGGGQGEGTGKGDARGELQGRPEVIRDDGPGGAGTERAVIGHPDDALVDVEQLGVRVRRRQHERARIALGPGDGGVGVEVTREGQGLARGDADFASRVQGAEVAGRGEGLGGEEIAALEIDDVARIAEGGVVARGEDAGVDGDRAGEIVGRVGQQHRAGAVLHEAVTILGVGDLTGEDQAEGLDDRRGGGDVEVRVRAEVRGAGDFQAVDAVVVDEDFGQVGEAERGNLRDLVLGRRVVEEARARVLAVGDGSEVDVTAARDGDRGVEVDRGGGAGTEAVGTIRRAAADDAVEEQVQGATVEVDQAGGAARRGRVTDELEGGPDVDGGGAVGVRAGEDEAARVRLHQDVAGEGVGTGEAEGAEAGLGHAGGAAEVAGDDGFDVGRARDDGAGGHRGGRRGVDREADARRERGDARTRRDVRARDGHADVPAAHRARVGDHGAADDVGGGGRDGGDAVLDLERAEEAGRAPQGDRVGEGQGARRGRGREDEGGGVVEEAVGTPGQLSGGPAEVDGAVRADRAETTRGGELDLAGAGADRAGEVAHGEFDRTTREVEVVEAAGHAAAARQGVGGGEADGPGGDAGLAGVAIGAGERQDTEAGLGQATGTGEVAREDGVDQGRAVGDIDRALGRAEVDRVGEGDGVARGDVGQQERGASRDEAARTPVEDDARGAEVDGAVGVERVETGRAGELRLVRGGAEGAGEVAEGQTQFTGR